MELLTTNAFVIQLFTTIIGGLILWRIVKYISYRQRVKAVNRLELLEARLKRFLELEKNQARAHLTLIRELIITLRLATFFLLAILSVQLVSGSNARHLFIGMLIGILISVSGDLKEHARLARGLLEPEKYRRELAEEIERHKRLKLTG